MIEYNNDIVQSLWVRGKLTNNEIMSIKSYLMNGHTYHLYTYDDINNVPSGVILKDGNNIIPSSSIFEDTAKSLAGFSDWFRFKLLYENGGWWVDTDTICLKYFNVKDKYCFSSEYDRSGSKILNATYIKSCPKSELLGECLNIIDGRDKSNIEFGEFGLKLFRRVMVKYEYVNYMKPPETFCPINWFELYKLISLHQYQPHRNTVAIHLWNEIWHRGCLNKNATYHPNSIYENLKRRYLKSTF